MFVVFVSVLERLKKRSVKKYAQVLIPGTCEHHLIGKQVRFWGWKTSILHATSTRPCSRATVMSRAWRSIWTGQADCNIRKSPEEEESREAEGTPTGAGGPVAALFV